ncbi:acid phosphatase type 7 [uncultured Thiomicrorhabdus sp.]
MKNFWGLTALSLFVPAFLVGCGGSDGTDSTDNTENIALCKGSEISPERLFLQQLGSDRVIIKWRGNVNGGDTTEKVCLGTHPEQMLASTETMSVTTEGSHEEALIEGLQPDTTYFYSIGGAPTGAYSFTTAPIKGSLPSDGNIRIWVLGDAGTAGLSNIPGAEAEGYDANDQIAVKTGYYSWLNAIDGGNNEPADLLLMLGDNAYLEGTDEQYQRAVFDMYPQVLASTSMWSTIGNHEMGLSGLSISSSPDLYLAPSSLPDLTLPTRMPYLDIHSFPKNGENGGVPSGTEQYYSFDYGNVHFISLDSQVTARDESNRAAMKTWLEADLSANTSDWTIVIFHHPPYTKGSHDSDDPSGGDEHLQAETLNSTLLGIGSPILIDQPIFDMREEFNPIFERYGVDLVYSGHSHSYERSYYVHNHTGLSTTFDPNSMAELADNGDPKNGREIDGEGYSQITQSGMDDKVVYTVAGSSGKTSEMKGSHPVHYHSEATLGSVVIDINATSLVARFIGTNGEVLDYFNMTR